MLYNAPAIYRCMSPFLLTDELSHSFVKCVPTVTYTLFCEFGCQQFIHGSHFACTVKYVLSAHDVLSAHPLLWAKVTSEGISILSNRTPLVWSTTAVTMTAEKLGDNFIWSYKLMRCETKVYMPRKRDGERFYTVNFYLGKWLWSIQYRFAGERLLVDSSV